MRTTVWMGATLALLASAGCVAELVPDPEPEPTPTFDPFAAPLFDLLGPEQTGIDHLGEWATGVGVADIDLDGLPDLFFTDWFDSRIFRNLGDFRFEEMDNALWRAPPREEPPAGRDVVFPSDPWGITFADYDNDGDPDLFLLASGPNRLFRNDGDWAWTEVTAETGWTGTEMTYSLAVNDYDRDGFLDLYFVNHIDIVLLGQGEGGEPDPNGDIDVEVRTANDYLWRNRGDGSFEDVTALLPAGTLNGTGWTALWSDLDLDGDRDLYVASEWRPTPDVQPNHLFRNDGSDGAGGWTFTMVDEDCFCDVSIAPMGVTAGDFDRDGLQDIYMTNTFVSDSTLDGPRGAGEVLLRNEGDLVFVDASIVTGADLSADEPDRRTISWGTDFFDADNDGWLDLYVSYGPFFEDPDSPQPNGLLISEEATFRLSEDSGLSVPDDTRGVITVDLDGDGCLDVIEAHPVSQPGIFRNRCASGKRWLQVELTGTTSPRDAIGAIVRVTVGDVTWTEELIMGSVHSSPWKTLHFGLGTAVEVDRVEITWPHGLVETRTGIATNQKLSAVEGDWQE